MAGQPDLLTQLQQQLAQYDEATLVALANKGLLRRARKDLETITPQLLQTTDRLTLQVGDYQVKIPTQGAPSAQCSCPSGSICQHILSACLWLVAQGKTQSQGNSNPPHPQDGSDSDSEEQSLAPSTAPLPNLDLLNYSLTDLKQWAGKKVMQAAWGWFAANVSCQVTEAVPIVIDLSSLNATCRYFPGSGLNGMICSCKSSKPCDHRVVAVLLYQRSHGIEHVLDQESSPILSESAGSPRNRTETIQGVQYLLEELITLGLCHLSESTHQRLTTLAMSALGVNLPRLSLALRRIANDVWLNLQRDAQADLGRLLLAIARTYALCLALHQDSNNPDWVGQHRSQYRAIGTLVVSGVGAYSWKTQSNYTGLTVLFWDNHQRQWYSWSEARPTFKGISFNPIRRYQTSGPWQGIESPAVASCSLLQIQSAQSNAMHRLSGTQGHGLRLGDTQPEQLDFGDRGFRDWQSLHHFAATHISAGLKPYDPLQDLVVVYPTAWGTRQFDPVTQTFQWAIADEQGAIVALEVPFQPMDEPRIQALEALNPEQLQSVGIVARWVMKRDRLGLYPISLLCPPELQIEEAVSKPVINLGLERSSSTLQPAQSVSASSSEPAQRSSELDDDIPDLEDRAIDDTTCTLLERCIDQLIQDLEHCATQGTEALRVEWLDRFKGMAQDLNDAGVSTLALPLWQLSQVPTRDRARRVLQLRYLCQLCQEVAGAAWRQVPT